MVNAKLTEYLNEQVSIVKRKNFFFFFQSEMLIENINARMIKKKNHENCGKKIFVKGSIFYVRPAILGRH